MRCLHNTYDIVVVRYVSYFSVLFFYFLSYLNILLDFNIILSGGHYW